MVVSPHREIGDALKMILAKRGSPEMWVKKEHMLTRFIADQCRDVRVLAKGEVWTKVFQGPAVLTYNPEGQTIHVWGIGPIPEFGIQEFDLHDFHSNTPHSAVAQEVLDTNSTV